MFYDCQHKHTSFPRFETGFGNYIRCLDCGARAAYSMESCKQTGGWYIEDAKETTKFKAKNEVVVETALDTSRVESLSQTNTHR